MRRDLLAGIALVAISARSPRSRVGSEIAARRCLAAVYCAFAWDNEPALILRTNPAEQALRHIQMRHVARSLKVALTRRPDYRVAINGRSGTTCRGPKKRVQPVRATAMSCSLQRLLGDQLRCGRFRCGGADVGGIGQIGSGRTVTRLFDTNKIGAHFGARGFLPKRADKCEHCELPDAIDAAQTSGVFCLLARIPRQTAMSRALAHQHGSLHWNAVTR
jgi:hypothetical protein